MGWLYLQVKASPILQFFTITFMLFGLASCSKMVDKQMETSSQSKDILWGYVGENSPEHWSKDYPQCELGGDQSPINIDTKQAQIKYLSDLRFTFTREPTDFEDNGHTVEVVFSDDNKDSLGQSVTLNYNEKGQTANSRAVEIEYNQKQDTLSVDDEEYRLAQFHFHSPSENKVNSQNYPMELHLVYEGDHQQFVVVAVFLTIGTENPTIRTLWEHMPTYRGQKNDIRSLNPDFSGLLPNKRGYYTFQGSFTTPPCTRDVTWYVFHEPITVSQAQVNAFQKVMNHNNRPLQPLNNRAILSSQ